MREIKFRHWCPEAKYMTPFEYIRLLPSDKTLKDALSPDGFNSILIQYTGLKDKNGKEIYEGDILIFTTLSDSEITEIKQEPVFVKWNNHKSTYDFSDNKNYVLGNYPFYKYWTLENMRRHEVEVIGNIYENPGLLAL